MGTRDNPGAYDCAAAALPDEPIFTLLARDLSAPKLLREWAAQRQHMIRVGLAPKTDGDKVTEALVCAAEMENWRRKNDGKWRRPKKKEAS